MNRWLGEIRLTAFAEPVEGKTINMYILRQVSATFNKATKAKRKGMETEEFSFEGE